MNNIALIHRCILKRDEFSLEVGSVYVEECFSRLIYPEGRKLYTIEINNIGPPILLYDQVAEVWVMLDLDDRYPDRHGFVQEVYALIPFDIRRSAMVLTSYDFIDVRHAGGIVGLL